MPIAPMRLRPSTTSSGILASRSIRSGSTSLTRNSRNVARKRSPFSVAAASSRGWGWIRSRRKLPRNSSLPKLGSVHSCSRAASATWRASRSVTVAIHRFYLRWPPALSALPQRGVAAVGLVGQLGLDRAPVADRALDHRELDQRVGRRVLHLAEGLQVEVVDRVARLVVARVEREPGGAAEQRGLRRRLDDLGAGEEAA